MTYMLLALFVMVTVAVATGGRCSFVFENWAREVMSGREYQAHSRLQSRKTVDLGFDHEHGEALLQCDPVCHCAESVTVGA